MYTDMEHWAEIRRRVLTGEISKRAACRHYDIHWQTLKKILEHDEPPGFRLTVPRARPRLGPFLPIIHAILEADREAPKKQRHTARRIFDRLREEHGYTGCESIVRSAVAQWKRSQAEVFVPLSHPPGEAAVRGGVGRDGRPSLHPGTAAPGEVLARRTDDRSRAGVGDRCNHGGRGPGPPGGDPRVAGPAVPPGWPTAPGRGVGTTA